MSNFLVVQSVGKDEGFLNMQNAQIVWPLLHYSSSFYRLQKFIHLGVQILSLVPLSSTDLRLDREEVTFFLSFWKYHRRGKVAIWWFTNFSNLLVLLLDLVTSHLTFWIWSLNHVEEALKVRYFMRSIFLMVTLLDSLLDVTTFWMVCTPFWGLFSFLMI